MTKTYELPNGRIMTADFDENGIGKITVQALDSLVNELNEYASEECDNDCEHCAYLECPKEPTTLKQIIEKHNMDKLAYDEMSDFERDVLKYAEQEPTDKSTLEKICEELAAENDDLHDQLAMRDRFKQEPNEDAYDKVLAYLKANVDDFPDYHEAIEAVLNMRGGE